MKIRISLLGDDRKEERRREVKQEGHERLCVYSNPSKRKLSSGREGRNQLPVLRGARREGEKGTAPGGKLIQRK